LSGKYTKYKPEFRDEIAKLIVESNRSIAEVVQRIRAQRDDRGRLGEEIPRDLLLTVA
jgi:transposase-like protein